MNLDDLFAESPLHTAISKDDLAEVTALLDAGADLEETDMVERTPLMTAVTTSRKFREDFEERLKALRRPLEEKTPTDLQDVINTLANFDRTKMMAVRYNQKPQDTPHEEENTAMLELLLKRGANPNAQDKEGKTPLICAATSGWVAAVGLLLDYSADTHPMALDGKNALMWAAQGGKLQTVRLLLERGADWDARNPDGGTALMFAAKSGNVEIARLLVAKGADPNTVNVNGSTALVNATLHNHPEMREYLQSVGAKTGFLEAVAADDLEAARALPLLEPRTPHYGFVVLDWAVRTGRKETLKFLLDAGVRLIEGDEASQKILRIATMRGDAEILKLLMDSGGDTETKLTATFDLPGKIHSLSTAISTNNLPMTKLLIERGADVNGKDDPSLTPLLQAVVHSNVDMVNLLIDAGADVNGGDKPVMSPLLFATTQKNEAMVSLLLLRGADPKGRRGEVSPMLSSIGTPEIQSLLKGASAGDLHELAGEGNLDALREKLGAGADINLPDNYGMTPLHRAIEKGQTETVRFLLDNGANLEAPGILSQKPLLHAVAWNQIEITKLLIECGADIFARNDNGKSALLIAALNGYTEIVELLTGMGATLDAVEAAALGERELLRLLVEKSGSADATNPAEMTPLMGAAAGGQMACLTYLLAQGANPNAIDNEGNTPLHHAVSHKRLEAAQWLLENGADVNLVGRNQRRDKRREKRHEENPNSPEVEANLERYSRKSNHYTPLVGAVFIKHREMAELLIAHGAIVNVDPKTAIHTPLRSVVLSGDTEMLRFLLDKGADPTLKDDDGRTALDTAKMMDKHPEIIAMLEAAQRGNSA